MDEAKAISEIIGRNNIHNCRTTEISLHLKYRQYYLNNYLISATLNIIIFAARK